MRSPSNSNSPNSHPSAEPPQQPLPLSDFEFYMFSDDRASHPMTYAMSVMVSGPLQRSVFETALAATLLRHPLLNARVTRLPRHGWCWVAEEFGPALTSWASGLTPVQLHAPVAVRRLDISRERGLQVDVRQADDSARVLLTLHHCCCDGIGAIQLIGDLFAEYGLNTAEGPKRPELPEVRHADLLDRELRAAAEDDKVRPRTSLRRSVAKVMRLMLRRPMPVRSLTPAGPPPDPSEATAIRSMTLSESVRRRLMRRATALKVSANDLCIREMMLQVLDWNERGGALTGDPWIRVTVPISVRSARHRTMPAANLVSYAFFTRRKSHCSDPDTLLQSINDQSTGALFGREGLIVLKCIRMLRRVPGLLKLILSRRSRLGSVVLANVGHIRKRYAGSFPLQSGRWVAGNVVIESIDGVAPVRPNTTIAVTIGEYAGRMTLNLRADGTVLSDPEADQFLQEFGERLQRLAELSEDVTGGDDDSETDDCQVRPGRLAISG